MLLNTQLPLHGSTDFSLPDDDPLLYEWNQCKLCPICGTHIKNDSRYCHKHAKMLDHLRPKIDRLIELARERRHAHDRQHA